MFTTTDQFGVCPYDGFYIHAFSLPRPEFIQRLRGSKEVRRREVSVRQLPYISRSRKKSLWRHFVSLPVSGQMGALKVMWDPLVSWTGMPLTRVYFNPSTTGYDAQQTYELLLTVLDDPLVALMSSLDTKVDVMAPYWLVAAHIYYPYARYVGHADWLTGSGTIYEGKKTRLSIYAKFGDHDEQDIWRSAFLDQDLVDAVTRIEMRQRFLKPKPTFGDYLRGSLVEKNRLQHLRVVSDLELLKDRLLADEARTRGGLTRALREYQEFANVSKFDIAAMKEHINAISSREIFDHYRKQADAWHQTFRG